VRYPDVFGAAIGMSGSYRIERFYDEAWSQDLYHAAPLQFLPGLAGPQLDRLRQRRVVLASGAGSGRTSASPGGWPTRWAPGHPQPGGRLGPGLGHQWPTWRQMLPQYLRELT